MSHEISFGVLLGTYEMKQPAKIVFRLLVVWQPLGDQWYTRWFFLKNVVLGVSHRLHFWHGVQRKPEGSQPTEVSNVERSLFVPEGMGHKLGHGVLSPSNVGMNMPLGKHE